MSWLRLLLLALVVATASACTDHQQVAKHASHVASNSVAEALAWIDARTAADFERRSEQKIEQLRRTGGTPQDYAEWLDESGWTETRERIERAYQAHGLIVSYLDGEKNPTDVRLQSALEDIREAIRLGIAELESHGVQVPSYVEQSAEHLPKLETLL